MKKIFFLICLQFILVGCSDKKTTEKYPIIDLVGSVEKYQRIYCSDYFSSIELIPLETKEECLLPSVPFPNIILKDSFIFINGNCLYAFNSSGKFLNQIGKKGQGPGEYLHSTSFFLNTDTPVIYVDDIRKIVAYDFNGNFIHSIQRPTVDDKDLYDISYVGDGLFVGQQFYNGKNKYKYGLFSRNGEIIKCFPSYIFLTELKNVPVLMIVHCLLFG